MFNPCKETMIIISNVTKGSHSEEEMKAPSVHQEKDRGKERRKGWIVGVGKLTSKSVIYQIFNNFTEENKLN